MIPYEYYYLVPPTAWIIFTGYLVWLCCKTFKEARRKRDLRKLNELKEV